MSLLRNSSSKILRSVGTGVGPIEAEGALVVGAGVGIDDILGVVLGAEEGGRVPVGSSLGCDVSDGTREGYSDGGSDGMVDTKGANDGSLEVEGCIEGIPDGA